jgi:hypothetical protein
MRYVKTFHQPTQANTQIHESNTPHTEQREEIEMFLARYSGAHNEGLVVNDKNASNGSCRERSPIVYCAFEGHVIT